MGGMAGMGPGMRGGRGRGMGGPMAMGGPGMRGGMGGPPPDALGNQPPAGPNGPPPTSAPAGTAAATQPQNEALPMALRDLRAVLADRGTTEQQVQEKLKAVRDARAKIHADLDAARTELLKTLTLDQQATLVAMGFLE